MLLSKELLYGSNIKKISINNFKGKEISFPQKDLVTLLFFFDINYIPHQRIISELNILIINLNQADKKIDLIGISKDEKENFEKIKPRLNIEFNLVNDMKEKLFKFFNYTCGKCIQVILIDKGSKLRYNSSNFDPVFIRELLQRYSNELS